MKCYNKCYEDKYIAKGLSSEEMFHFSDTVEVQRRSECVTEKNVSDWKEKTENKNDRTEMTGVHFGGRSPENVQS